jgi:hypothetical protein
LPLQRVLAQQACDDFRDISALHIAYQVVAHIYDQALSIALQTRIWVVWVVWVVEVSSESESAAGFDGKG